MTPEERITAALAVVERYGQLRLESHHQDWLLDQMVRALTGEHYAEWVAMFKHGDEGPDTYEWDTGIPP